MRTPEPDFIEILRTLLQHDVELIVVGGVCAVLHGAPVSTFDLDLVHRRERANLDRLLAALKQLDAYYRIQPEKRLRPRLSHLASGGHQLLMTRFGPLDLLGTIGHGHTYEELVGHTTEMSLGPGLSVKVLDLSKLIQVKEETIAEKDKATLPILRRTLAEKKRTSER